MRKHYRHSALAAMIRRASRSGAVPTGSNAWCWDISGSCQDPYTTTFRGIPDGWSGGVKALNVEPGQKSPIYLDLKTPCRRCEKCLKKRRALWYARMRAELGIHPRSWFGTLTLSPEHQYLMKCRAVSRLRQKSVTFEKLSEKEQFSELAREGGKDITKYLKRVRKQAGPLRYCLVVEAHKSGLPHWHILFHEVDEARPVLYRHLADTWKLGFTKFNLCEDTRAAGYLSKYLAKSMLARVRASENYGSPSVYITPTGQAEGVKPDPTSKPIFEGDCSHGIPN